MVEANNANNMNIGSRCRIASKYSNDWRGRAGGGISNIIAINVTTIFLVSKFLRQILRLFL